MNEIDPAELIRRAQELVKIAALMGQMLAIEHRPLPAGGYSTVVALRPVHAPAAGPVRA